MWFSVSVRRHKKALTNLIVNPKRWFLWESLFLKSVLFLVFEALSWSFVLLWLGFLPWVFQGSMRKKSQPSKVEPTSIETPSVVTGKLRNGSSWSWCKGFRSSSCHHPYQSWGKASASRRRPARFSFIWACYRNGRNSCSRPKSCSGGYCARSRTWFLIKIGIFKLNAAPGAEGRQVDVKDWKKIRSSSWLVYFLWFRSQLSCSKWRWAIKRRGCLVS